MTLGTTALFAIAALMVWATTIRMQSTILRHEAALAEMRRQLEVYDTICRAQGDAELLLVRHQQGSDSTWVDIVLTLPGFSLRAPIRPEEMEGFIARLRG